MADLGIPADALARCRELFEPAMRAAVADLHPWGRRMAAFTLGWSDIDGTPVEADTGKGLRPVLAMLCAEAAGAPLESAVPGAVAVELVHAFSLVHDDIIDSDERRRHRPAVWKAYGVGPAVLAGDALLALAIRSAASGPHAAAAAGILSSALVELVHGQTEDMAFEERPWTGPDAVTVAEYLSMAGDKTGSLLGCAAALGVTFAGAPGELATRMYGMGRDLGLAFQMVDDVLGIWGDPSRTGKPIFGDLRQRKKTLPVLAALTTSVSDSPSLTRSPGASPPSRASGSPDSTIGFSGGFSGAPSSARSSASRELAKLLASGADDEDSVRLAADLIEKAGGRARALSMAADHASRALETLDATFPAAHDLRSLAISLLNRTH
ncbi:family 2 encapsulin nanocompartment cargo protein polyprenyl transferase [Nonomuraea africana]|uniref:Geranylgeranyl diphosphate synthase type I n=1 Tax=Nonomuraea africana TaxID=46171 RepID=A0ABR9KF20_9ACTN|nr:polyprenyl synthetase family protein [Nonomuraea africana]MBE1560599.1 geranylgeranyl diphosphate synthase type I [Nonomuraea africana]